MDRIIIRDLRANSLVGTLEREQKYRQEIAATLTLEQLISDCAELIGYLCKNYSSSVSETCAVSQNNEKFQKIDRASSCASCTPYVLVRL